MHAYQGSVPYRTLRSLFRNPDDTSCKGEKIDTNTELCYRAPQYYRDSLARVDSESR